MARIEGYTPGIRLIGGLAPSGSDEFPLIEAHDILVEGPNKRLDERLSELSAGAGSVDINKVVDLVLSKLPADSPLPHEILTETEMTAILTNATQENVGAVYRYIGPTTSKYENGQLYILDEDIL